MLLGKSSKNFICSHGVQQEVYLWLNKIFRNGIYSRWKTSIIVIRSIVLYFTLWFFRNCLIGQGYTVKISDFAMFRPGYSSDYFKASENSNEISSSTRMSSEPIQEDLIPLRWIPWEVYIMVRTKISYVYNSYIYYMHGNITYNLL